MASSAARPIDMLLPAAVRFRRPPIDCPAEFFTPNSELFTLNFLRQ